MQEHTQSFGYWLRRRRKALDLTQESLAQQVSCSAFSIRKIEADERRPSRPLAQRLALALAIPDAERAVFLSAARASRALAALPLAGVPLDPAARGARADLPAQAVADGAPDVATGHVSTMAAAAGARDRAGAPVAGLRGSERSPFVGRASELGLLAGLLDQLHAGAGCCLLVDGEPGIGKSRLMRELVRLARAQGIPTLATKCWEIERAVPYQPVIKLITDAFELVSAGAGQGLSPVLLAEIAALVPEVGERFAGLPQLSNDFPEARQARLPRAVDQWLEAARRGRAAILMADDIQWADDASLQVLQYLARGAAQRPMLVVYAYRDDAVDSDDRLARLVDSLSREADARRVSLARLAAPEIATLVAALAPAAPGLTERLHRESDGNPFFLISILQSLADGVTRLDGAVQAGPALLPDTLRAAVRVRLAHLPRPLQAVLECAAVIGRRVDLDTLLDLCDEPESQLLDALDTLVRRHLLREEADPGVYDFSHDKLREVVYRDIGGARRQRLHLAVAEAIERRAEATDHERDAQLGEHYERAQVWPKALQHLRLAGQRSQALFALRDALHWFDRAVALCEQHPEVIEAPVRLSTLMLRGLARAQAGLTLGAVADIGLVLAAARASADIEAARDALVALGMAHRRADAYDEATRCLSEALAQARAMGHDHQVADTCYHLGTVAWSTGRNDQAIDYHHQSVDICERRGYVDLVAVQAWHGRGEAHYAHAEPHAAIDCFRRSIELARAIGERSYESENLMMIGHACVGSKGLGDYPRAIDHFDAALAIARSADLQWHLGPTLLGQAHAQACTGHYGQAWTAMSDTLGWLHDLKQTRYQLIAYDFIGQLLLDLGHNELAIDFLDRGLALVRASGIMFWRAAIDTHLAVAHLRLGRPAPANELPATLERTCRHAERHLMSCCLDGLAEAALAAGDPTRALAYADESLVLARANGLREIEAGARRRRGEALMAQQAGPAALAELSQAAALADEVGRVSLQRDVHLALARLLRSQGQAHDARRHTVRAVAVAQAMVASLGGSALAAPS